MWDVLQRQDGALHIPEHHEIVKFLFNCATQQQVQIDLELVDIVKRDDTITTSFDVLVRLHNLAEEFGILGAMTWITSHLPLYAIDNPGAALGFAFRDSPPDRRLAYFAICNFTPQIAEACGVAYWNAVGRNRQVPVVTSRQTSVSWAETLHATFVAGLQAVVARGYTPTHSSFWSPMAFHFLMSIDAALVAGDGAKQHE